MHNRTDHYLYPGTNIPLIRGGAPASRPMSAGDLLSGDDAISADDQAAMDAEPAAEPAAPETPQAQAPPQPPQQAPPPQQAKPDHQPEPAKTKAIPYERFHEVNEERKQLRAKFDELSEKWARLEERSKLAREAQERIEQAAKAPVVPPKPDPETDPYGAQLWERDRKIEQLEAQYQQVQQVTGQTAEQLQRQAQANEFLTWYTQNEQVYRAQHPEYDQHSVLARTKFEEFFRGMGLPEQQVQQMVTGLAMSVAQTAKQLNQNPAEAYDRLGQMFAAAQPAQSPAAAPAVVPTQAPQLPPASQVLEQVKKGQAFQGLGQVPAAGQDNENWTTMTAADLAAMPEEDFISAMANPQKKAQIERLFARLELGA